MSRPALPVVAADPGRDAALTLCVRIRREPGWVAEEWRAVLEEDGFGPLPAAAALLPADIAGLAAATLRAESEDDASAGATRHAMRLGRSLAEAGLDHAAVMRLHFLLREALRRAVDGVGADAAMAWLDPALALAASAALAGLEHAAPRDAFPAPHLVPIATVNAETRPALL
ncbi:MAG: hypothetical protein ACJ8J0_02320 [Longimicrobiaceae bacterium]